MTTLIWIIAFGAAIAALAYRNSSLYTFTLATIIVMALGSFMGVIGFWSWLIFAVIVIPINVTSFRKQYLSLPALKLFRSIMPEMSSTEKEAIAAGTTWWDADLFSGNPDWQKLHSFPKPQLTAEEQSFLNGPVEKLCRMVDDWDITHKSADLSPEVWQYLKDNKFFAMIIKKKYGGLEFSANAQSTVLKKLTGASSVLASTVGVPNSLGPGELLQHYGTPEQQDHYLPRLATGEEIPCFALTSPEAGSDAGAIPDFGVVCKGQWEGKETLGMKLTWNKRYITLAPVATVLGLAFKLQDPDGLLGDEKELGITCALIPVNTAGVEIGRRHFPLNNPFQNGPTKGNQVFVPLDFIIGGPKMAGQGWRMLVECLSVGRCITLPSTSTGGVKTLALATGAYSRIRRQFRLPIGKMEGIEEPLARIGGNAYMMEAATNLGVTAVDLGEKPSVISAIVKYHMTDKMRASVTDSMDIHGGKGVMLGPNNYVGRGYQGAPISITVEGANILTRNMIIYGQGAMRCHPYVLQELNAAYNEDQQVALEEFDEALFGHIGHTFSNLVRSKWMAWSNARLVSSPYSDSTKPYYQQIARFSAHLALMSDVAMATLGGDLKRRERVSARLGDILSYIYIGSATLKRYNDEGRQQEDLPLLQWALEDCLNKAEVALDELLSNFPNKAAGWLMRAACMPWGRINKAPSDKLDHKVARILQTPSDARSRLAQNQYLTRDSSNVLGKLEQTLDDILASEPLFDKVCKATQQKLPFTQLNLVADMGLELGVLNQEEADLLRKTEQERLYVINVDDFAPEELVIANPSIEATGKAA